VRKLHAHIAAFFICCVTLNVAANAQSATPASPTWDVYPVRHLSRPPSLWRFGGFSLPAEVVLMVSLSNHQTQAGPRGGAIFAIRQALDNARHKAWRASQIIPACRLVGRNAMKAEALAQAGVLVQAYSFTSAPIAEALVKAHRRGVRVQVLLDKSQRTEKYSSADFLANAGISTKIPAEGGSASGGDAAHACLSAARLRKADVPKRLYNLKG